MSTEIYEDFHLRIIADGESFRVLAQSSAGETGGPFRVPEDLASWNRSVEPDTRELEAEPCWTPSSPEKIGGELFQALLSDSVRRLFDRTLTADSERNVRIRIHIDPRDKRLHHLVGLPWELLYCIDTCEFLNLNRRTPVVRSLDTLQPTLPVSLALPLRVLLVIADPEGTFALKLAEERSKIEKVLRSIGSVELEVLEHATRKGLRRRLVENEKGFHIVHFMGYGSFNEGSAEGFVRLENVDGTPDLISGEVLATLLKQGTGPALVILNAYQRVRSHGDSLPLSSVATALVGRGIPAVLAMRKAIGDHAAITLIEEVYEKLAAGGSVEAAVSEARLALYGGPQASSDWAIPALFVRASPSLHREPQAYTAPSSRGGASSFGPGDPTTLRPDKDQKTPIKQPISLQGQAYFNFLGESTSKEFKDPTKELPRQIGVPAIVLEDAKALVEVLRERRVIVLTSFEHQISVAAAHSLIRLEVLKEYEHRLLVVAGRSERADVTIDLFGREEYHEKKRQAILVEIKFDGIFLDSLRTRNCDLPAVLRDLLCRKDIVLICAASFELLGVTPEEPISESIPFYQHVIPYLDHKLAQCFPEPEAIELKNRLLRLRHEGLWIGLTEEDFFRQVSGFLRVPKNFKAEIERREQRLCFRGLDAL